MRVRAAWRPGIAATMLAAGRADGDECHACCRDGWLGYGGTNLVGAEHGGRDYSVVLYVDAHNRALFGCFDHRCFEPSWYREDACLAAGEDESTVLHVRDVSLYPLQPRHRLAHAYLHFRRSCFVSEGTTNSAARGITDRRHRGGRDLPDAAYAARVGV